MYMFVDRFKVKKRMRGDLWKVFIRDIRVFKVIKF